MNKQCIAATKLIWTAVKLVEYLQSVAGQSGKKGSSANPLKLPLPMGLRSVNVWGCVFMITVILKCAIQQIRIVMKH